MNAKQAVPLVATLAPLAPVITLLIPVLLIGGATVLFLRWLCSEDEPEKKAEAAITVTPVPIMPPPSIPKPVTPAPAPIIKRVVVVPLLPPKRKAIERKDLASVFLHGTCTRTRAAAVAALQRLGFGKSAAYRALSPDGRFASWLQIAPDGIVNWTDKSVTTPEVDNP
jgi:hypothetical protein